MIYEIKNIPNNPNSAFHKTNATSPVVYFNFNSRGWWKVTVIIISPAVVVIFSYIPTLNASGKKHKQER